MQTNSSIRHVKTRKVSTAEKRLNNYHENNFPSLRCKKRALSERNETYCPIISTALNVTQCGNAIKRVKLKPGSTFYPPVVTTVGCLQTESLLPYAQETADPYAIHIKRAPSLPIVTNYSTSLCQKAEPRLLRNATETSLLQKTTQTPLQREVTEPPLSRKTLESPSFGKLTKSPLTQDTTEPSMLDMKSEQVINLKHASTFYRTLPLLNTKPSLLHSLLESPLLHEQKTIRLHVSHVGTDSRSLIAIADFAMLRPETEPPLVRMTTESSSIDVKKELNMFRIDTDPHLLIATTDSATLPLTTEPLLQKNITETSSLHVKTEPLFQIITTDSDKLHAKVESPLSQMTIKPSLVPRALTETLKASVKTEPCLLQVKKEKPDIVRKITESDIENYILSISGPDLNDDAPSPENQEIEPSTLPSTKDDITEQVQVQNVFSLIDTLNSQVSNAMYPNQQTVDKCSKCGKISKSDIEFNFHRWTHSDIPYECVICDAQFQTWKDLLTHTNNTSRLYCNVCGVAFCTTKRYENHMVLFHSGTASDRLPHGTSSLRGMIQLVLQKQSTVNHNNTTCNVTVTNDSRSPVTIGVYRYTCFYCFKKFSEFIELQIHVHKHKLEVAKGLYCEPCVKSFRNRILLKEHLRRHD